MTATRSDRDTSSTSLPAGLVSENRRQRRWSLALVGALVVIGSGLVFVLLFISAGDRSPVLMVSRDIPSGQVIESADLTVVRVGADTGVETIPESRRSEAVGQTAAVDLISGSLLVDGQLGKPVALESGKAVVGLDLVGGERAIPDLTEGDEVLVVLTSPLGDTDAAAEAEATKADRAGTTLARGRVLGVTASENDPDRVFVSVVVPEADSGRIAGANSSDRVSLVLVAPE